MAGWNALRAWLMISLARWDSGGGPVFFNTHRKNITRLEPDDRRWEGSDNACACFRRRLAIWPLCSFFSFLSLGIRMHLADYNTCSEVSHSYYIVISEVGEPVRSLGRTCLGAAALLRPRTIFSVLSSRFCMHSPSRIADIPFVR